VPSTLVIVKPDAVARGLIGEIVGRLEARGLTFERAELRVIDRATAQRHYAEHEGKPFYDGLVEFITSAPSLVMIVNGPDEVWQTVRTTMGATNPSAAAPGTIRGDLAVSMPDNLVHGSDSPDAAQREIAIFFP
jgi:nucleoside-diphosphate kinase